MKGERGRENGVAKVSIKGKEVKSDRKDLWPRSTAKVNMHAHTCFHSQSLLFNKAEEKKKSKHEHSKWPSVQPRPIIQLFRVSSRSNWKFWRGENGMRAKSKERGAVGGDSIESIAELLSPAPPPWPKSQPRLVAHQGIELTIARPFGISTGAC